MFVNMCFYLCQRHRLSEKVVGVSFLQLFQRTPQQHKEGSKLHLQRHLLNFNLNTHAHSFLFFFNYEHLLTE